jgi:glycosyltransferase involved in cell wall biosynthesis
MTARVAAVAPGDPFAVSTFSGISAGLLGAIRDRGALVGAVDGYPGWLRRVELVASFHPNRARWRQQYHGGITPIGPLVREGMSEVARRRVAPIVREQKPDAVLQLTGWYRPDVPGVMRASYHDGNLASYLEWPDVLVDRDSRAVGRLLRWERRLYDETAVIFTMSEWLRRTFIDDFGQDPKKVIAVGGGSDLPEVPDFDRSWDPPRFLFVGREFERKGGREVLRAWPAIRAQHPNAELHIVGPRTIDEPLPAGVTLTGRIDRGTAEGRDAYLGMYRRATAFVMPSLYESFGIVFLEAMTHGLGCIAANRCAMPEIVEDGVTGRVVDPTDPDALAGALLALADPDTARRMGDAGRHRLRERFTWPVVADRILAELTARIQRTPR